MGQRADRNVCDLLERVGAERQHLVEPTHGDVGEAAFCVAHDVDVIRDRTGFENLEHLEGRLPLEGHHLAQVFEGEPDLISFRSCRDVRAEGRLLLHLADDLVVSDGDDGGFRGEAGAHVAVLAVGREDGHPRPTGELDPPLLREGLAVEHRDVVLAAHRDPDFSSIRREESFVR